MIAVSFCRSESLMTGHREGNLLTVQSVNGNNGSRIPSPSGIAGPFGNTLPRNLMTPEAFISIQLEKVINLIDMWCSDVMSLIYIYIYILFTYLGLPCYLLHQLTSGLNIACEMSAIVTWNLADRQLLEFPCFCSQLPISNYLLNLTNC
jgi:hypothetical protein